jgi:formate dehydrogenase accessory protein FdhE
VPKNEWQRRAERAQHLAREHPHAAEILRFLAAIAGYQEELWLALEAGAETEASGAAQSNYFAQPLPESLCGKFGSFLSVVVENGPPPVVQAAQQRRDKDESSHAALLTSFWQRTAGALQPGADDFLARAFLQPYAVFARTRETLQPAGPTPCLCPFCGRKPGLGVLRPRGDGGLRSLVCSFCLYEWEFRRMLCPACGEENHAKLPIYTAEEFRHVRVECCDTCRCYIKTVDLTKSGLAEPVVDEIASIPLDLWAQERGYAKLQLNLMQL